MHLFNSQAVLVGDTIYSLTVHSVRCSNELLKFVCYLKLHIQAKQSTWINSIAKHKQKTVQQKIFTVRLALASLV